ncbi:MAG: site-specific integrase [Desulfatibacillaceae bacterium]|nr:site-specific integrase [Desulfatibacillaceae bacterium]
MKPNFLNPQIRTYFVRQSYKDHKFGKPKKGKVREVDVPDFLLEELLRYRTWLEKESLKKGDGGKVKLFFQDPKEQGAWPFSQRKIQSLMKRVNKKAGLRHRHPHDLRHTYASIMLMAHQSPAYLQRQLGHSSIKTTVDVYGHWIPGEGRRNLEEALNPGSGNPKSDGKKVGHEGDREPVLRK